MSHLKNNYIFGILESRPTIWHTFKQISSTLNFWPPYNPMGSFWSPVFQNAQWCQSGISLFACQDKSKSQKQQKYCKYTQLPSPKFILLFVNSTMVCLGFLDHTYMYLDQCWKQGRTKLVLVPVLFRGIQATLTKYWDQVYVVLPPFQHRSLSAKWMRQF